MRSFADLIACKDALSPGSVVGLTGASCNNLWFSLVSCAEGGKLELYTTLEPDYKFLRFNALRYLRTSSLTTSFLIITSSSLAG